MGLQNGELSSKTIAKSYASHAGWTLSEEQLNKLATAIRTALSRERERKQIVIIRSDGKNGYYKKAGLPGVQRAG